MKYLFPVVLSMSMLVSAEIVCGIEGTESKKDADVALNDLAADNAGRVYNALKNGIGSGKQETHLNPVRNLSKTNDGAINFVIAHQRFKEMITPSKDVPSLIGLHNKEYAAATRVALARAQTISDIPDCATIARRSSMTTFNELNDFNKLPEPQQALVLLLVQYAELDAKSAQTEAAK